jgi:hypothetical protein
MKEMLKRLEDVSFDHLFTGHLPLYREILVDAEGNILVFGRDGLVAMVGVKDAAEHVLRVIRVRYGAVRR